MSIPLSNATVVNTAEAVGVSAGSNPSGWRWYIAIVSNNTEKATFKRLSASVERMSVPDYRLYLPLINDVSVTASGKIRQTKRVAIPRFLFVCCTEQTRRQLVNDPNIKRFFVDITNTTADGRRRIAIVPDHHMQTLIRMVEGTEGDCSIESRPLRKGTKVRVKGGPLKDIEGTIHSTENGTTYLYSNLGILGYGKTAINPMLLEVI